MKESTATELTAEAHKRDRRWFTNWVIVIGFMLWGFWVMPIFLVDQFSRSLDPFPDISNSILFVPMIIWGMSIFFVSMLFSNPVIYIILCAGGALIFLITLRYGKPTFLQGISIIYLLCSIIIFMVSPYRPAIRPVGNLDLLVPTEPSFLFRGLKNSQAIAEVERCSYSLLGWKRDDLFYEESCIDGSTTTWIYSPIKQSLSKYNDDLQKSDLYTYAISRSEISHLADSKVLTEYGESSILYITVPGDILQSPRGMWVALVAKHLYSAEDVIVIPTP